MDAPHILVVEDKSEWQQEIRESLEKVGCTPQIVTISNYDEARTSIMDSDYEVAIIDLNLKEGASPSNMDLLGMELLYLFRRNAVSQHCEVIILSSGGDPTKASRAFTDFQIYRFIDKHEFDNNEFLDIVRSALCKCRLERAKKREAEQHRLIFSYNRESIYNVSLTGPHKNTSYNIKYPIPLKFEDWARRAENINYWIDKNQPAIWRPELRSIGRDISEIFDTELSALPGLTFAYLASELSLHFKGPPEGLGIPFELLYSGQDYLALNHVITREIVHENTSVSRKHPSFIDFLYNFLHPRGTNEMEVLIIASDPYSNLPFALDEVTAIKEALKSVLNFLNIPHRIDVIKEDEATYSNLKSILQSNGYHILHYVGHGSFDENLPERSGILLNDRLIRAVDWTSLLPQDHNIQFVFLNCCLSGRTSDVIGRGDFHGMLDAIVRRGIPAVMGFRWDLRDRSALNLAADFYSQLFHLFSPGEALRQTRRNASTGADGRDDETWASPLLVMQNAI